MFPTEAEVIAAYGEVARRFELDPRCSPAAVRSALRDAEHLAEDVFEGPAAVLYAFARVPRAFGGYRTMTVLLTLAQVGASGQVLQAGPAELGELVERVAHEAAPYEEVRGFLAERLLPFGG